VVDQVTGAVLGADAPVVTPANEDLPPAILDKAPDTATADATYAAMLREQRSWGWWSLGLGILHLVSLAFSRQFLSAPWGILLLVVGAASFWFRDSAMFVVYGVTLGWAGLSNMISGQAAWLGIGALQLYLTYRVFKQFLRFRRAQADYVAVHFGADRPTPPVLNRARRLFPWAGCLLSAFGLTSLVVAFAAAMIAIALSSSLSAMPEKTLDFLIGLVVNMGVLGLAIGLASLLSRYRRKALAVIAIVTSSLMLLGNLALILLP